MTDIKYARDAFNACRSKYSCHYDQSLFTMKRNLNFVSLLSFAALTISPTTQGVYPVNLGVISGVVKEPIFIYAGLLLVCTYHMYLLWINCRTAVWNGSNGNSIEEIYMFELAFIHAFQEWSKQVREQLGGTVNLSASFSRSPLKERERGGYKVRSELKTDRLKSHPDFLEFLNNGDQFHLTESQGFTQIDYIYMPQAIDYKFVIMHKDEFWLAKKKEFIEFVLPILVGFVAFVMLLKKIAALAL